MQLVTRAARILWPMLAWLISVSSGIYVSAIDTGLATELVLFVRLQLLRLPKLRIYDTGGIWYLSIVSHSRYVITIPILGSSQSTMIVCQ